MLFAWDYFYLNEFIRLPEVNDEWRLVFNG